MLLATPTMDPLSVDRPTPQSNKKTRAIVLVSIIIVLVSTVIFFAVKKWPPRSRGPYTLDSDLSGGKLIPGNDPKSMRFYVGPDPTKGVVDYGAWADQVTLTKNGKTVVSAGPLSGTNRKMVRLVSQNMYNSGLFIISADHIPEGLGTWPAFWLTAYEKGTAAWACSGEIDIIEGVNSVGTDSNTSRNSSTHHTNDRPGLPKCRQVGVPGINNGGDCTAGPPIPALPSLSGCGCDGKSVCPGNGCGVFSSSTASFGHGFNVAGGGVYACELTPEGYITIWFFPVGQEPADIAANNPDPSKWPAVNRISFNACPGQFENMQIVLNTTLCGTWAGNVFPGGGIGACNAHISAADLSEAYWSIDYIKVFVRSDVYPAAVSPEPLPWRHSTAATLLAAVAAARQETVLA